MFSCLRFSCWLSKECSIEHIFLRYNLAHHLTHLLLFLPSVWTCSTYVGGRVQGEGAAENAGHENGPSAGFLSPLGLRKQAVEKVKDQEDYNSSIYRQTNSKIQKYIYFCIYQMSTLPHLTCDFWKTTSS